VHKSVPKSEKTFQRAYLFLTKCFSGGKEGKKVSGAGRFIIHYISGCHSCIKPNPVAPTSCHKDPGLKDKTQHTADPVKNFLAFVAVVLEGKNRR